MFTATILFVGCNSEHSNNIGNINSVQEVYLSPKSIVVEPPEVLVLDKSKVQKIDIPISKKSSITINTKDGLKRIDLFPPKIFIPNGGVSGGLSHFNTFNTEQGLSLSSIACGYLDRKGNLWFGTYGGGVNKYDGKAFTVFNSSHGLANNLVLCIKEDKFGNIWFGTQGGGVSKYDGKSFVTYNILNGLGDNVVYSIAEDKKGNLWFGTKGGGVSKYINTDSTIINSNKSKLFKSYGFSDGLGGNTIRAILEDKKGNLWFASENDGVSKFDGNSFTTFNTSNGLSSNTIWSIEEDYLGNIWFGTNGEGVIKYNGKSFKNYNTSNGLANNIIWTITEDKKGNIWFGSEGAGVSVYSENRKDIKIINHKPLDSTKLFTTYNKSHGLSNNVVFSITEDNNENIWFGTYGGGVCRFNGDAFVTFNAEQGLASNAVFTIAEDKNHDLWFGTYGGGVTKYNGKSFETYNVSQGLVNNTVWAITKDSKDNLWFGTYGDGVSVFDGKSFTNYNTRNGLPNNTVRCIKEDKNGNIWFGTEGGGVSKFNGTSFVNFKTEQGLNSNTIRTIFEDKDGNLWFGSEGSGVSKFDGKSFVNYNSTHGLINNVVRSICEDEKGNIWFGTQAGLSCLVKKQKTKSNQFLNFTVTNGLPDNYITQILKFKNNKIIIGTNNGLAIFNPESSILTVNKLVDLEIYNVNNNYPVKDVNVGQNAIYVDSKGIIWVGTGDDKNSLVRINYDLIEKKSVSIKPELHRIKINEQKIDWYSIFNISLNKKSLDSLTLNQQQLVTYGKILNSGELDSVKNKYKGIKFNAIEKFYPIPQNLILPYEHNSISFEFGGIEISKNFMLNYQYMLEGYDKNWSPVMKKTEANFGNINNGDYTFKLKVQSPNGIWSEPIAYHFTVLPPFYRTIWAYLFYFTSIILIFRGIIKWRLSAFKKRQNELEEIVKERTIEVVLQKEEAEFQKELVQEKQKEIVDSINYAKRIQDALLSQDIFMKKSLPNHFVFFKPKDIVSGDFYWSTEYNNRFYLAVCDSTGHGVPGAFMSLLNIGFLSEAIREKNITEPHEILNYVRSRLIESIGKEDQNDGMDGVLISFQLNDFNAKSENLEIEYSAANNAPLLIHNSEIIELLKDKMPIGKGLAMNSFVTHKINLRINDVLYLYTDGFADQFGGEKGKKFKRKKLNDLLLSISDKDVKLQGEFLKTNFINWKGLLEQVDDVCVVGIKL